MNNEFDANFKKKVILLIGGFIVVCIILLGLIIYKVSSSPAIQEQISPTPSPSPTPVPVNNIDEVIDPLNGSGFGDQTTTTTVDKENRGFLISEMTLKLPIKGENFSLSFDPDLDTFNLYINPSNPSLGESEYNKFLNDNGIRSTEWLTNVQRVNSPTN